MHALAGFLGKTAAMLTDLPFVLIALIVGFASTYPRNLRIFIVSELLLGLLTHLGISYIVWQRTKIILNRSYGETVLASLFPRIFAFLLIGSIIYWASTFLSKETTEDPEEPSHPYSG